ncbi:hypothetical protein OC846_006909 [Tilletia horrida]|uniref:Uncharacterized protein n=1 Tax=Tilletia horrida TaxID=155126 RepID=A0AAN6GHW5_9BASI|nr:hypothetical protein OC846_006909 [Tilletia horrida]
MATPIGLGTLTDLIERPELPIQERAPLSGITYLHVHITNKPWLQVLAQLASSFDYRSYPNLAELRLELNLETHRPRLRSKPTPAAPMNVCIR